MADPSRLVAEAFLIILGREIEPLELRETARTEVEEQRKEAAEEIERLRADAEKYAAETRSAAETDA